MDLLLSLLGPTELDLTVTSEGIKFWIRVMCLSICRVLPYPFLLHCEKHDYLLETGKAVESFIRLRHQSDL